MTPVLRGRTGSVRTRVSAIGVPPLAPEALCAFRQASGFVVRMNNRQRRWTIPMVEVAKYRLVRPVLPGWAGAGPVRRAGPAATPCGYALTSAGTAPTR